MKKVRFFILLTLLAGVFTGLYSCLKNEDSHEVLPKPANDPALQLTSADRGDEAAIPVPCGQWFFGSWGSSTEWGYHVYTDRILDLSGFNPTDIITVKVAANEVPNRFEIRTLGGALIAETTWLGLANYEPAPCITGNSSTYSTADITFVRGNNNKVLFRAITCSNKNQTDSWEAYYACPVAVPGNDCGKFFSGSWPGPGFHIYDDIKVNLTGVPAGTWICLECNSVEVPNRFDLKNYGPTPSLLSTNWIGASNYQPQVCWDVLESSPKSIRFQKLAGYDFATVSIATCPPPNQQDSWLFFVNCNCPPPRLPYDTK